MEEINKELENQLLLGKQLIDGEDYKSAFKLYKNLSDQGLSDCNTMIGWMYSYGKGVEKDLELAEQYLLKSARDGDSEAQFFLGRNSILIGDLSAAIGWLEKSANSGYSPALYRLGYIFDSDQYDKKNEDLAFEYYKKAAKLGHIGGLVRYSYKLMKGHNGFFNIPKGVYFLLKAIISGLFIGFCKGIKDVRLQT